MTQVTARDVEVLGWAGDMVAVRADLLGGLLGRAAGRGPVGAGGVNRVVDRWVELGLVGRIKWQIGVPAMIWVRQGGLQLAGLEWRAREPSITRLAHMHAVGVTRWRAEANPAWSDARWVCERELRSVQLTSGGSRRDHVPAAVLEIPKRAKKRAYRAAIEVELARKTVPRLVEVITSNAAAHDRVHYMAGPAAVAAVEAARGKCSATVQNRVTVHRLAETPDGEAQPFFP